MVLAEQQQTLKSADVWCLKIKEEYFSSRMVILNPSKTEVTVFYLNNQQATKYLVVKFQKKTLKNISFPKYLSVKMDRSLTFKQHLYKTAAKIYTRNNIIHKLVNIS